MGVAGLWEVLRPAGQVRSLTELAVEDGFNANPSHQRGFRIGIDASIWFFHAAYGREGENPELRTLFFRCCRLLQTPLLPLFVFDGPNRPAVKRGKRVGGNVHWLTQGVKNIIDAFGFEWWVAPGEAEAELAYLNRIGVIDAVLSDDVDNFLFGATMIIRNPSNTLSGNRAHPVKNSQGKDDGNHVVTYTANAILSDPSVALSRSGAILIGLLSGGDYIPAGLPGCGQKFATGLARAGFGDSLVKAVKELKSARLDAFLDQWRQDIRNELKMNKSGLLPSKKPSLAASLPDDFPSLPVLMSYADPLTSENMLQKSKPKTPLGVWRNDPDPMRISSLCELYFEWGVKEVIVHRFRTVLWPGIVCRAVRRSVVDQDTRRHFQSNRAQYYGSGEDDNAGPSSPTRRISSTLSALTLSSPSKKSSTATTASDPGGSESFSLSSLVPLASCASPSSFRSASPSSPYAAQSPLLQEVLSQRTHVSTDSTLEYRVLVDPTTLVSRAESGVKGIRPPLVGGLFGTDPEDEDADEGSDVDADESGSDGVIERLETAAGAAARSGTKKRKAHRGDPMTPLRLWVPACMVRAAAPALVEAYEEKVRVREEKKARRGARGGRGGRVRAVHSVPRVKDVGGDGESVPGPSSSKTAEGPKARTKVVRAGGGGGRRKPKQASEAQDDAYEFIDLSAGESPCSSDGEGVEENTKGKGRARARTGQANAAKQTTKVGRKTRKAAITKSKPSTSRTSVTTAPTLAPVASRRVYEEEEEDSADAAIPPPLPKTSRPLDLLRAKPKSSTAVPDPTSKHRSNATSVQRYEEEKSSPSSPPRPSGSKPSASSLPCRPAAAALTQRARKKPLFVDVSDSDSDIGANDVRHGDVSVSVGIGKTSSTLALAKGRVIDLTTKGDMARLKSTLTLMPIASHPPVSAPIGADMASSTGTSRTPSKLAHILLPQSALQSQEEGEESEGDELPTFHRGSAGSRAKKGPTTARPAPRPFPMQLALDSPVSRALRNGCKHDDGDDDVDMVEIVDVFTTPRGPSPPRSPTLSSSPDKSSPDHVLTGPSTFVKSKQLDGFPISPTESKSRTDTEPHSRTKHPRHLSPDCDAQVSGEERNDVLKSPRKSAEHSSPKHVPRASSPTPLALSRPAPCVRDLALWTGDGEGRDVSDDRQPKPNGVGRKPRLSDTSAIYISSESEDEGNATIGIGNDGGGGRTEVSDTDLDADGQWADTGMILSAPPSPACSPHHFVIDRVPAAPGTETAPAVPAHVSKFKPAPAPASKQLSRAPSAECRVSDRATSVSLEGVGASRAVQRAPLLAARARRNKGRDDDVIDLTSD